MLGLVCLLLFVKLSDVSEIEISKLDYSKKDIKITGEITNIKSSDKVSTITIKQQCEVDVVVFDNISSENLTKGDVITIRGSKQNQNGEYQIYADELSIGSKVS